jgi:hypothetical protein
MPDARILWTGSAFGSGDNQIDLVVPAQAGASDHALILWGAGGHNASQGTGRFARFTDAGATNWGHTAEIQVGDWPHTPFGVFAIYHRQDCGEGVRQGGTISVNFGGSGGSMDLFVTACVIDPGVPVEVRWAGDQTGVVGEGTAVVNLPGVRGYSDELEVMLIAAKSATAELDTLPGDWGAVADYADTTAVVRAWFLEHAPTTRDVEGGRAESFPWDTAALYWAAGTVIFTEVYEPQDRAPCGFSTDDWAGTGGGSVNDAQQRASVSGNGEVAGLAPWDLQAVVTPADERLIRQRVFFPVWPTLGAGEALVWELRHPATGAYIRMTWEGGATIAVEERTPYGLVISRGTPAYSADHRWWLFESTVNAAGNTWTNRIGPDADGVALSVAATNWTADGGTSDTGSEARKWLVAAEVAVRLESATALARASYWNGCGPDLEELCQDFEDGSTHDDVFAFNGSADSVADGDLVVASGIFATHLGDVVGYPLPLGIEISAWPVPHAGFPTAWSVEMAVRTALDPDTGIRSDGASGQLYEAFLFVDANEVTADAWAGPGFTDNLSSTTPGAPDKASLRFWRLRDTGGGLVLETAPTGGGPWTVRLDMPGWSANPDGYQLTVSGRAFNGTTFDGGGFAVERVGCFAPERVLTWVAVV